MFFRMRSRSMAWVYRYVLHIFESKSVGKGGIETTKENPIQPLEPNN